MTPPELLARIAAILPALELFERSELGDFVGKLAREGVARCTP
jgi:hypothetical protein